MKFQCNDCGSFSSSDGETETVEERSVPSKPSEMSNTALAVSWGQSYLETEFGITDTSNRNLIRRGLDSLDMQKLLPKRSDWENQQTQHRDDAVSQATTELSSAYDSQQEVVSVEGETVVVRRDYEIAATTQNEAGCRYDCPHCDTKLAVISG